MAWTELSIEKYEGLLALVDVPKFAPVNYEVKRGNIIDPEPAVRATLAERGVLDRIHPVYYTHLRGLLGGRFQPDPDVRRLSGTV